MLKEKKKNKRRKQSICNNLKNFLLEDEEVEKPESIMKVALRGYHKLANCKSISEKIQKKIFFLQNNI